MLRHQAGQKLAVSALMGLVLAYASTLSANAPGVSDAKPSTSMQTPEVEFRFEGRRLLGAMADISRRSGVQILVAPELVDETIDARGRHADWQGAIKSLLKGFDYLAIVDRTGRFRKIWLTGNKASASPTDDDAFTESPGSQFGTEHLGRADDEVDQSMELPTPLWQPLDAAAVAEAGDQSMPSAPIEADPAIFETIRVGQPLEILIPQEGVPLFAVVGETHSQLNGEIQVWSGPIDGSHETASFTITRGEVATYITVATGSSIYEVSVDNATGLGQVVDEVDLTKGKTEQDFLVPPETPAPSD